MASAAAAGPPVALPITETVHGITLTDEYRWMEDAAKASEMDAWVLSESTKANAALQALPERAAFAAKLEAVSSGLTRLRGVQIADPVTVFRRASAGDKTAKLIVRERGKEQVLLDPNSASGAVLAINNVSLSPDGKRVAVHQAKGGGEVAEITIVDVATGKAIGTPIETVWGEFELQWIGDDWVPYTQMAPAGSRADPLNGMRAFLKRIGDPGPGRHVFGLDSQGPAPEPSSAGPFLAPAQAPPQRCSKAMTA